jgi:DUF4097 and DUF4098 domain-containing protein YvlB
MKRHPYLLIALSSLLIPASALATPIDETLPMDGKGRVSIEIIVGKATIRTWDRDEFRITGEVNNNADGYELENHGGNISFEEQFNDRDYSWWNCWFSDDCSGRSRSQSEYEIFIPRGSELNIEVVNASLDIAGIENGIDAESVNGRISVTDSKGNISLETVNGDIDTERLDGRLEMEAVNGNITNLDSVASRATFETVNGRIRTNVITPRVEMETVNGDVQFETSAEVAELSASTVNGDLELLMALSDNAEIEVSSLNGDITLELPDNSAATFAIKTRGDIRNGLSDDEAIRTNKYINNKELNFSLGSSRTRVDISSHGGDIRLDKQ